MDNIIISPRAPKQVTIAPPAVPTPNTVTIRDGQGGARGLTGPPGPVELIEVFTMQRVLYPLVGKSRLYFESNRLIYRIRASVGTAPVGSPVIVTAYVNGISIGNVTIAENAYTGVFDLSYNVHPDDYLTVSVVMVGATNPGEDLTVTFNIN